MDIRLTAKQTEILLAIKKGNPDRSPVSVYDIIRNVSYEVKRDALLHSMKILIENGYVERKDTVIRESRNIRVFILTTKALSLI